MRRQFLLQHAKHAELRSPLSVLVQNGLHFRVKVPLNYIEQQLCENLSGSGRLFLSREIGSPLLLDTNPERLASREPQLPSCCHLLKSFVPLAVEGVADNHPRAQEL